MKKRIAALTAVAALSLFALVAMASAGGGTLVSNAPDLPIGTQVVSGCLDSNRNLHWYFCADFWGLNLASGDQVVIDYGSTNSGSVHLCMIKPGVTDYTYDDDRCSDGDTYDDSTDTSHEMKYVASVSGKWVLQVKPWDDSDLAYQLTAWVKHLTSTSLSVPRAVTTRHKLQIKGAVTGATGGQVIVNVSKKGWKRHAVVAISGSGSFSWATKVGSVGRYSVSAQYYGDSSHRSSSKTVKVRVI